MSQYRTDEIESTDLATARLNRALNDPIIVHRYAADWAPPQDHDIYANTRAARLQQTKERPINERITEATIPETVVYLATATMDSSCATPELVDIYQAAYRDYLQTWTETDPDTLGPPLDESPGLTEHEDGMYRRIREAIKQDRDRWFAENRHDDLDLDVPQTYWTDSVNPVNCDDIDATVRDVVED